MGRSCSGRKGKKKCIFTTKCRLCLLHCSWNNLPTLAAILLLNKVLGSRKYFQLSKKYYHFIHIKKSNVIFCFSTVKLTIKQLLSRFCCTRRVTKYKHFNLATSWQNFQLWVGRKWQKKNAIHSGSSVNYRISYFILNCYWGYTRPVPSFKTLESA